MATITPTSAQCPPEKNSSKNAYLKFTVTSITDSDAATNERYISWKITVQGTPWSTIHGRYATLGNVTIRSHTSTEVSNWSAGQILDSGTTTFQNENDGNLSLPFYMKQLFYKGSWAWDYPSYCQEVNETFVCSQVLRYANFTSHTGTARINSITVTYSADAEYKAQKYTIDGGTTWLDATANSYTISGLTPDTTYNIKTKIQRTDSELWTESEVLTLKTLATPSLRSPVQFNVITSGTENITVSITSASYIDYWYIVIKDGNNTFHNYSNAKIYGASSGIFTISASDFPSMVARHSTANFWYLNVELHVVSSGTEYTKTHLSYFRCDIPSNLYLPTYTASNLSYAVTDALTLSLNNNNTTKVIKGISTIKVTSTAATGNGGATISSYSVSSGTKIANASTTTAPIEMSMTEVDGSSYTAQVTDSRGKATAVTKDYASAIDYIAPRVTSATINRVDALGTNVTVNIIGTYTNWSGLSTSNTVEQVSIQYKKTTDSSWTTKTGITLTRSVNNGSFTFTGTITGNNFVATNKYDIKITLKDKIQNFEVIGQIPEGKSLIWKDLTNYRVGINKKPTSALDVQGDITGSGNINANLPSHRINNSTYNTSGSINMYDRTLIDSINANRTAFFPGDKVYIEHSVDGGSTWTEYPTSSFSTSSRKNLFAMTRSSSLYFSTTTPVTTNMQLRITLQFPGTAWYCSLDRLFLYLNTGGHTLTCTVEKSTYGAQSTYTSLATDKPVSGWSGPNMIAFTSNTAWGTNNSAHIYNIRLTFKIATVREDYNTTRPSISDIRMFGSNYWGTANTPRYNGSMFSWDVDGNVNFPAAIKSNGTNILLKAYPVGSIYMSVNSTSPATLFGGTWERLKDTFLLGAGDTYTNGDTGGSSEVTLTEDQMPTHTHIQDEHQHFGTYWTGNVPYALSTMSGTVSGGYTLSYASGKTVKPENMYTGKATATNQDAGGGQPHDNMPPYLVVYMWKRTA